MDRKVRFVKHLSNTLITGGLQKAVVKTVKQVWKCVILHRFAGNVLRIRLYYLSERSKKHIFAPCRKIKGCHLTGDRINT